MKNIITELEEYNKLSEDRRAVRPYDLTAREAAILNQEENSFQMILQAYKIGFVRGARFQAAKTRKAQKGERK